MKTVATETRNQAFKQIKEDGTQLTDRERVLEAIRQCGPISDAELARKLHQHVRGIGARRNELCAMGEVVAALDETGEVIKLPDRISGVRVTHWVIAPAQAPAPARRNKPAQATRPVAPRKQARPAGPMQQLSLF